MTSQLDSPLTSLSLFAAPEHQPFYWEVGQPAALLIHGFLGTPAELRPLAREMHQVGWTTQGLLLPGFGDQIDTLFTRRWSDWRDAARETLAELQEQHEPVILIGYSLGAAVALSVAGAGAVDGLVLIAPFWRLGTPLQRLIWQVLKRLRPQFKPFQKANFSDPRLATFFAETMPELDLADAQVQATLRQLTVPSRFMDQLLAAGRVAERAAASVQAPTLIVQGTADETVKTAHTRQLLQRMAGPVTYEEVAADHDLVAADNPGFGPLSRSVLAYAGRLAREPAAEVVDGRAPLESPGAARTAGL